MPIHYIDDLKQRIRNCDLQRIRIDKVVGRKIPQIEDMQLGEPREFELAVMHVDMEDFTELSSSLSQKNKLRFLNIFLSEFTALIHDYDGFVEKYGGDSITALFGFGKSPQDSCANAINCGVTMLTEVYYAMNAYLESIGLPKFSCRIGIDYGQIWMARVGIKSMNQLTLVGDAVIIAKQLEEFAEGHKIFIGNDVYVNLPECRQRFCQRQENRDFNWTVGPDNKPYAFYHYRAHWKGYSL